MHLDVGETVILLQPPLHHVKTPTKGRGGVQQNGSADAPSVMVGVLVCSATIGIEPAIDTRFVS